MKLLKLFLFTISLCSILGVRAYAQDVKADTQNTQETQDTQAVAKLSNDQSPDLLFKNAVNLYEQKKFNDAEKIFQQIANTQPENLNIISNWALAEYNSGKKYSAIGHLRQVLYKNPWHPVARTAYGFILSQTSIKEIPRKISSYESFRQSFLFPFPSQIFFLTTAILLLGSGLLWLRFLSARKLAIKTESRLPSISFTGIFLSLLFVFSLAVTMAKIYDSQIQRGTVIEDTVKVRSAPGENQVEIGEFNGGFEVILGTTSNDWIQISYPGAITGWVKSSAVLKQ